MRDESGRQSAVDLACMNLRGFDCFEPNGT